MGLVTPERADDAIYARVDAERDEAATAALAGSNEQLAPPARHVA